MATSAYLTFTTHPTGAAFPNSDGLIDPAEAGLGGKLPLGITTPRPEALFQVLDYSTDLEQTLNLGSQSTGTGAGKVTFNPLSITRTVDPATPQLLYNASAGTSFRYLDLFVTTSAGPSPMLVLLYRFGLCAVKTLAWSSGDDGPTETVTFEFGALIAEVNRLNNDGTSSWTMIAGWNRVKNVRWNGTDTV